MSYSISEDELARLSALVPSRELASYNQGMIYHGKYETAHFIVYKNKHGRMTLVINGKDGYALYKRVMRGETGITLRSSSVSGSVEDKVSSIGYDETAVGSLAGGIYSACVFVQDEQIEFLRDAGVKDSKRLSDSRVIELATLIRASCRHFVFNFTPSMYNARVGSGKPYNSASIKSMIADFTIQEFSRRSKVSTSVYPIIVDAFSSKSTHLRYMESSKVDDYLRGDNLNFVEKADGKYISVACASILARARQLIELGSLGHTYFSGKRIPIGAGSTVDEFIRSSLADGSFRAEDTPKVLKCNFSNLERCGLGMYRQ